MKFAGKKMISSLAITSLFLTPLSFFSLSCSNDSGRFIIANPLTVNQAARSKFKTKYGISNTNNIETLRSLVKDKKVSGILGQLHNIAELIHEGKIAKIDFKRVLDDRIINFPENDSEALRDVLRNLYTKDVWQTLERYNSWVNMDSSKERISIWEYIVPFSMSSSVVSFDFKLMDNFDRYDTKVKGMINKNWSPAEMKTLRNGTLSEIKEMFKVLASSIEKEQDIDLDGIPNWLDEDMDGDGIPNLHDPDQNGDGQLNIFDDIDYDGIPNQYDDDIDGDGLKNWVDDDMDGDGILNIYDNDADGDGILDYNNITGLHDSTFLWSGKEVISNYKLTYSRILTVLKHRGYENIIVGNDYRKNMYIGSEFQRPDLEIKVDGEIIEQPTGEEWKPSGSIIGVDTNSLTEYGTLQIEGYKRLINYFTSNDSSKYHVESNESNMMKLIIDNAHKYDTAIMSSTEAASSLNGEKLSYTSLNDSLRFVEPDNPMYELQVFAIPKYMENTSELNKVYDIAKQNIFDGFTRINTNIFTSNSGRITSPSYAANFDYNLYTPTSSMIYGAIVDNKSSSFMQYSPITWELIKLGSTWGNDFVQGVLVKVNNRNILMPITNIEANNLIYKKYIETLMY